ncbi:MAG TPA: hypothetical protein VGM16_07675 [Gammaproteobacteria bacterium]|jgi:hypothetical protein
MNAKRLLADSLAASLVCVAVMALAGCLRAPDDVEHEAVSRVGRPLTLEDMQKAIPLAAQEEDWEKVALVAPGHYVVTRTVVAGQEYATVDVFYTAEDYSIHYKDSLGLRYDGLHGVIGPRYQTMVGDLAERIFKVTFQISSGQQL